MGNNTYVYCGNNSISRIDSTGRGWIFILGWMTLGGVLSTGFNALENEMNGEKWYYGGVGSFIGGFVSSGIAITGHVFFAAYAGECISSTVNEYISYSPNYYNLSGSQLKTHTKEDYDASALIILSDTIIGGTVAAITGHTVDKLIPINKGWKQPSNLKSMLFGAYSTKARNSTLLDSAASFALKIIGKFSQKKQTPSASFSSKPFVGVGGSLYGY